MSIVRLQFGVTKFEEIILTDEEVCDDDVDEQKEDLHQETFPEKQESKIMSKVAQRVFNDITQLAGLPGVLGIRASRNWLTREKLFQRPRWLRYIRTCNFAVRATKTRSFTESPRHFKALRNLHNSGSWFPARLSCHCSSVFFAAAGSRCWCLARLVSA